MDTTPLRKVIDLSAALLRAPADVPRYLSTLPPTGRTPLQVGLPWFTCGAIRALDAFLRRDHTVFEFGSGGSTLFLARRAAQVVAVESHEDWMNQTQAALKSAGLANVDLRCHPLSETDPEFRRNPFFHAVTARSWDVVIVDSFLGHGTGGINGKGLFRPHAFQLALAHVKPGGWLVLDDSWMFPELLCAPPGWTLTDYKGIGPCRWGVSSTAIFQRDAIGASSAVG
jgi:hypothetical protein